MYFAYGVMSPVILATCLIILLSPFGDFHEYKKYLGFFPPAIVMLIIQNYMSGFRKPTQGDNISLLIGFSIGFGMLMT